MMRKGYKRTNSNYIEGKIPKIYQAGFIKISLWAWVEAQKQLGIEKAEAVLNYREHMGYGEDELALGTMLVQHHRTTLDFIECCKTEGRTIINRDSQSTQTSRLDEMESSINMIASVLNKMVRQK